MNKYKLGLLLTLALLLVVFFYKSTNKTVVKNNKIKVVTSFYPLYFFASEIGGEKAEVSNVTPAGAEPHDYEPTSQDIINIEKSNLLVLNGGNLEPWGEKIKHSFKGVIIIAGDNLINLEMQEEGERIKDPHVWLSPLLAKKEIKNILSGYLKIDPNNKSYYEDNTKKLEDKLNQLDGLYAHGLSQCAKKTFITSHAAFGYLAKNYNLIQVSISGLSPEEEPSTKRLVEISDIAKKNNVKYIFFESLVSPKLSETVANEIGAKTLVLDPIEGVSNDDMKIGKNYLTIMKDNLKNLQTALECQ
jgi:zinc transport system substrate-binding protein